MKLDKLFNKYLKSFSYISDYMFLNKGLYIHRKYNIYMLCTELNNRQVLSFLYCPKEYSIPDIVTFYTDNEVDTSTLTSVVEKQFSGVFRLDGCSTNHIIIYGERKKYAFGIDSIIILRGDNTEYTIRSNDIMYECFSNILRDSTKRKLIKVFKDYYYFCALLFCKVGTDRYMLNIKDKDFFTFRFIGDIKENSNT